MTRIVLAALVAALSFASTAEAQTVGTSEFAKTGRFGLGLGGSNLAQGVSGKFYLSDSLGLQASAGSWGGWGLGWGGLSLAVDGLVEMPSIWSNQHVSVNWNVGGGGAMVLAGGYSGFGASAVGGLSLQIKKIPLEFVGEVRPTLLFGNYWGGFYFGGGSHVRWYF